jgi:hypothetical protein
MSVLGGKADFTIAQAHFWKIDAALAGLPQV